MILYIFLVLEVLNEWSGRTHTAAPFSAPTRDILTAVENPSMRERGCQIVLSGDVPPVFMHHHG